MTQPVINKVTRNPAHAVTTLTSVMHPATDKVGNLAHRCLRDTQLDDITNNQNDDDTWFGITTDDPTGDERCDKTPARLTTGDHTGDKTRTRDATGDRGGDSTRLGDPYGDHRGDPYGDHHGDKPRSAKASGDSHGDESSPDHTAGDHGHATTWLKHTTGEPLKTPAPLVIIAVTTPGPTEPTDPHCGKHIRIAYNVRQTSGSVTPTVMNAEAKPGSAMLAVMRGGKAWLGGTPMR